MQILTVNNLSITWTDPNQTESWIAFNELLCYPGVEVSTEKNTYLGMIYTKEIMRHLLRFNYELMSDYVYFNTEDEAFEYITNIENICKDKNIPNVNIIGMTHSSIFEEMGYNQKELFTTILDLTQNIDQLWANMGKKNRNQIRKGIKSNVELKIARSIEEFDLFYQIYEETALRKKFGYQSRETLLKAFSNPNLCKIFVSFVNGKEIASGHAMLFSKDCMRYWLGASLPEYHRYCPTNVALWKIIEYGVETGLKVFDTGGILPAQKNTGPTHFKLGFGGTVIKYYQSTKTILPLRCHLVDFVVSKYACLRHPQKWMNSIRFNRALNK